MKRLINSPRRKRQYGLHCLTCGINIYSNFRHDFQWCACYQNPKTRHVAIAIDGGFDYQKISFNDKSKYKRISRLVTHE